MPIAVCSERCVLGTAQAKACDSAQYDTFILELVLERSRQATAKRYTLTLFWRSAGEKRWLGLARDERASLLMARHRLAGTTPSAPTTLNHEKNSSSANYNNQNRFPIHGVPVLSAGSPIIPMPTNQRLSNTIVV